MPQRIFQKEKNEMKLESKQLLVTLAAINEGDWDKEYRYIKNCIKPTDEEIERFSPLVDQAMTILDEDYPNTLKSEHKPPMVLFCKEGERSLLSKISISSVSVLGDGKDAQTKKIIDGVLAHGGLIIVPELDSGSIIIKSKTQSLTLSEYPDGAYDAKSQKQRERTVRTATSFGCKVFIGITKDSSAVDVAVNSALAVGRDVCVAPTRLGTSYKNNELIRDGAYVVLEWSDLVSKEKEEK
jgi:predicted Rossmann fold nucleotide-binding protein DprA/Smf involved in DNA uptake